MMKIRILFAIIYQYDMLYILLNNLKYVGQ